MYACEMLNYNEILSQDLAGFVSWIYPSLITVLGISVTAYIFLAGVLERNRDQDYLTDRLMKRMKAINERGLCFLVLGFLVSITMLTGLYKGCLVDTKGYWNMALGCLLLIETIGNAIFWWRCIKINHVIYWQTKRDICREKRKIKKILQDIEESNLSKEQIRAEITKWYGSESWKGISFSEYVHQFMAIESLLNCQRGITCDQRLERDIGTQINLKFNSDEQKMRNEIMGSVVRDLKGSGSAAGVVLETENLLKNIDNRKFLQLYEGLIYYRDMVRYQLLYKKEAMKKGGIDENVLIAFNILMLKVFTQYLSSGRLYKFKQDHGKFKYAVFYNFSISECSIVFSDFSQAFFVRCNVTDTILSDATYRFVLIGNVVFKDVDLSNSLYVQSDILSSDYVCSNLSFSEFRDTNITSSSFEQISGERIVFCNVKFCDVDFTDIQFREIDIKNVLLKNCQFRHVYLKKIRWMTDLAGLEDVVDLKVNRWEKQVYKRVFRNQGCDEESHWDDFLYNGRKYSIWEWVKKNAVVHMQDILFEESSALESDELKNADLENSRLCGSNLDSFSASCCNLYGVCFQHARLVNIRIKAVMMEESNMDQAGLYKSEWELVNFYDAVLSGVNATKARFTYIIFDSANCSKMLMSEARVRLCSFYLTNLMYVDMGNAMICKCVFRLSAMNYGKLERARFKECKFSQVSIQKASIKETIFVKCKFIRADFKGTSMCRVEFKDCRLEYPDFLEVDKSDIVLTNSVVVCNDIKQLEAMTGMELRNTLIVWRGRKTKIKCGRIDRRFVGEWR